MTFLRGRKRDDDEEESDVTVLHQAAKISGLEEQVQGKQRTEKLWTPSQ